MEKTIHIRTNKKFYYGAITFCILLILYYSIANNQPISEPASSVPVTIAFVAILYCFYKILFGRGKIILSQSEFKVYGHSWTNWDDLIAVYPFVEQDSENGAKNYIHFRLTDGTDNWVRSENLEMSFEQIAELVNQYKADYNNSKESGG